MNKPTIVAAQLNYLIGDLQGNTDKIIEHYQKSADTADLFVCTELCISGYYPKDLIDRPGFLELQNKQCERIKAATVGRRSGIVIGAITENTGIGKPFFNSAIVYQDGAEVIRYHKQLLPTYDIFNERRHFEPGPGGNQVFALGEYQFGLLICEDGWYQNSPSLYPCDPAEALPQGLSAVISINASPSSRGKEKQRVSLFENISSRTNAPVVYVNQCGGNDDIVFDGNSFVIHQPLIVTRLGDFSEAVVEIGLQKPSQDRYASYDPMEYLVLQLIAGIRDYVEKTGMPGVVIGSSGGIDSAVTIALAELALGEDKVKAITMPSPYSSEGSVKDSEALCSNLGVELFYHHIVDAYDTAVADFAEVFGRDPSRLTRENIQARIRGRVLMAFSNEFGNLVLSTGNKSEMAVGYATLYGDMNGGLNALGDVYKTDVYELAHTINAIYGFGAIPESIIDKAPSAELSPDQQDSDSLPDYPVLDSILKLYLESDLLSFEDREQCLEYASRAGQDVEAKVKGLVDKSEFKRRQAPPIIRTNPRSFGYGRQMPIAARYP